jgi:predicted N-acetyltransferase YhbS
MTADPVLQPGLLIQPERPEDAVQVEALVDHAFGPGRFTKVSERVREFAEFRPELSFCAWNGERLAGVVRQWLVCVGERPVIFLGPLAVDAAARELGFGAALVERACEAASVAGFGAVLLVGDEPYFQRMGFSAAPARGIVMPGPVDQRRVLVRALAAGGDEGLAGPVRR